MNRGGLSAEYKSDRACLQTQSTGNYLYQNGVERLFALPRSKRVKIHVLKMSGHMAKCRLIIHMHSLTGLDTVRSQIYLELVSV